MEQHAPRWFEISDSEQVEVSLSDEERELLWQGLHQWGGPTRPTDAVANVIGFEDVETLHRDGDRIRHLLRRRGSLTKLDWARALIAVEIVWASEYYGAAGDWEIVSGWSDERTLQTLRSIQRKLNGLRAPPRKRSD